MQPFWYICLLQFLDTISFRKTHYLTISKSRSVGRHLQDQSPDGPSSLFSCCSLDSTDTAACCCSSVQGCLPVVASSHWLYVCLLSVSMCLSVWAVLGTAARLWSMCLTGGTVALPQTCSSQNPISAILLNPVWFICFALLLLMSIFLLRPRLSAVIFTLSSENTFHIHLMNGAFYAVLTFYCRCT